jgi:hypothetical protein
MLYSSLVTYSQKLHSFYPGNDFLRCRLKPEHKALREYPEISLEILYYISLIKARRNVAVIVIATLLRNDSEGAARSGTNAHPLQSGLRSMSTDRLLIAPDRSI